MPITNKKYKNAKQRSFPIRLLQLSLNLMGFAWHVYRDGLIRMKRVSSLYGSSKCVEKDRAPKWTREGISHATKNKGNMKTSRISHNKEAKNIQKFIVIYHL